MSPKNKDLYETLGVEPNATKLEIKKAYKKAASDNHPDKGGSHDAMTEITLAYGVLKDEEKRERYDRTGQTNNEQSLIDQVISGISQGLLIMMEKHQFAQKDYFKMLSSEMDRAVIENNQKIDSLTNKIKKYSQLMGDFSIKNKALNDQLVAHVSSIEHQREKMRENKAMFDLTREVLAECEYTGVVPEADSWSRSQQAMFTSTVTRGL